MALTITRPLDPDAQVEGAWRIGLASVTFDSSYPTGGEAVTPADFGLDTIDFAICNITAVGGTVNVVEVCYDRANKKLMAFDESPAEVANGASLATLVVQVVAFGH